MSDVRTVTVTACEPKTYGQNHPKAGQYIEGVNKSGPWRMHKVLATDDTGLPMQDDIVSFELLPVGEPVELEFTEKNDPQYGRSYSVSLPKGSRAARPQPADDGYEMLRESIRLLTDRVNGLESILRGMGGFASTPAQTDVPAVIAPPVGAGAATPTDDIPFAPSVI